MARRVRPVSAGSLILLGWLSGCSEIRHEERPPWRAQAEQACLAEGHVVESQWVRAAREMDGPGICGLTRPFKVTALAGGSVAFNSTATLDCPMIAALDGWLKDVVEPAAQARFGEPVVRINSMGSYSCRGINNMSGAKLSEHSFGNALDIGGFVLASGREVNVMRDFNGADEQARAFLHEAHGGACSTFTTVLGPGANVFHYNHIHVDLALHGATSHGPRRYCKPTPEQTQPDPPRRDDLPDPPPIEEEMDIARAPIPAPSYGRGGPVLSAGVEAPVMVPAPARGRPLDAAPRASYARSAPRTLEPDRFARRGDPPLVTFSYVGSREAERAPVSEAAHEPTSLASRPLAFRPLGSRPPMRGDATSDEPPAEGAAPAEPSRIARKRTDDPVPPADVGGRQGDLDAVPAERPDPSPEGTPRDWDLTSSVRR